MLLHGGMGRRMRAGHDQHKHHKQGRHHAGLMLLGRRQLRQGFQACMPGEVDCRECGGGGCKGGGKTVVRQGQGKAGKRLVVRHWKGQRAGAQGQRVRPLAIQSDWQDRFLHLGPTGRTEINRVRLAGSISAFEPDWQDRNQSSPTGRIDFCI